MFYAFKTKGLTDNSPVLYGFESKATRDRVIDSAYSPGGAFGMVVISAKAAKKLRGAHWSAASSKQLDCIYHYAGYVDRAEASKLHAALALAIQIALNRKR